jgi:uncharacterized protein with von Willebrand factor type A (vWA) domain
MLLEFFYELRRRKVPASTIEWMVLMRALELGLHDSSLDGFYDLARTVLVKNVAHYDAFDAAFLAVFQGVTQDALLITRELEQWLADAKKRQVSDEERRLVESLSPDELRKLYEKRLKEQKERHDGGSKWIGTGGTSPFGQGGAHPSGMSVGGGGARSAMQRAGERAYRAYRSDLVLDVRRIDVALRLLRDLGRDGAPDELDLDETIGATAKNAGDLELVMHPPRRNRTKLVLLMDVGGSMDPHSELVGRLFTAASRSGRFARFRSYYFHNCVYAAVYEDAHFRKPVPVADLVGKSDRDEKLVIVGDAAMHPAELLQAGGAFWYDQSTRRTGLDWMTFVAEHFRRRAWLNPEPEAYWAQTTVKILRGAYPMFPLTLDGLERAVKHLVRGGAQA